MNNRNNRNDRKEKEKEKEKENAEQATEKAKREKSVRNKTIDFSLNSEEGRRYGAMSLPMQRLSEQAEETEREANFSLALDRIVCGDAFAVLSRLPKGFADLIVVDPPYNLTKDFHGNRFAAQSLLQYRQYTEQWMDCVLPCLKPTGTLYVCCDWYSGMTIAPLLAERLCLRGRITWQREKGRGAQKNWKNGMEDIWFATASEKEDYTFCLEDVKVRRRVLAPYREAGAPKDWQQSDAEKFRDTCPSNFWDDISIPYWSMAENTAHPTQKPEKLLAKLILASSNAGELVLDPFAGSGSTAVTAKKLGRHFLAIEQNPLYCAWGEKRLCDANEDSRIQGYEDGVFWERNTSDYLLQKNRLKAQNKKKEPEKK